MKRKPIINIGENVIQFMSDTISRGLFNSKVDYTKNNLKVNNFQGIRNLNFIFNEFLNTDIDSLIVYPYKRGAFTLILIYDISTKTLLTLTSELNIHRLFKRKTIKVSHYIDALILLNNDFSGDAKQLSLFDTIDHIPNIEDREQLKNNIISLISDKDVEQYVIAQYRIDTNSFNFLAFEGILISENFEKLYTEDWSKYISPNYGNEFISEMGNSKINEKQEDYLKESVRLKKLDNINYI